MTSESERDAVVGQALVAQEIRRYRERAGLSLNALAARVGYSRTYISASEKPGAGLISGNVVKRIDDELGANGALVALHARADNDRQALRAPTVAAAAHSPAPLPAISRAPNSVSPDRGEMATRRTVHPELITHYETLTESYRQIDYQAGSAAVYAETVNHLNRLLGLADDVPSNLYQKFALVLGDSAQLAAWLAIDHQDYNSARHYSSIALASAQECADPTLHAYVLGIMSYIHLHAGRGLDAVRLLEGALRLAGNPRLAVHAAVHSWLWETIGEASAMAGNRTEGAVALATAERLFDTVDMDTVPGWLGFFNSTEHIQRLKGRCLVRLADPRAAVAALHDAVGALSDRFVRERSGTLIDLAEAYLIPALRGPAITDPDAAAATALEAWQLAVDTASARNQRRVRTLGPLFEPHRGRTAVTALLDAVR